jgi:hypothetical protein
MREARAVYRSAVKTALERIKPESTEKDVEWIVEDFHQKMKDHRERLGEALRIQAAQLVIGPILGGLFSAFGLLLATLATVTGLVGGLPRILFGVLDRVSGGGHQSVDALRP